MGWFGRKKKIFEENVAAILADDAKTTKPECDDVPKGAMMPADEAFDIAEAFYQQGKYEESNRYYHIAAEQGHARAINCLGCLYRYGEGVQQDINKALDYYETALAAGNSKAGANIGMVYYGGEGGLESDFEKAFPYLLQAAKEGVSYVMPALSDLYYQGAGCEDNEKLAAYFAYQAVEQDEPDGYYMLGICFDEGIFFPECTAVAKYCFEHAAENGYDVAEYLESEKYQAVEAVDSDIVPFNDNAPDFFTQECPYKQYMNAIYLLNGIDSDDNPVQVDPIAGRRLLEQAAEQGYAEAQYSLGTKYLNTNEGDGIRYDEDGSVIALGCDTAKALHYLDLAARQGHPEALDALIDLYGIGEIEIEQDIEKSDEYQAIKYKLFQDEDDRPSEDDDDKDYKYEDDEDENSEDDGKVVREDYESGAYYIGNIKNGMRNGHGKYVFTDGSYYEGDFLNGDSHGIGTHIYANGDKFHGRWQNDCKNGLGRMDYTDGSWYFGQFEDDGINGYGVYFDGEIFRIGRFEDGRCVTESDVKQTMKRPSSTDIGDGVRVYCDVPKDPNGYSVFRSDNQVIYGKNDGSWITRYNRVTKKMEMGTIDSESRLNDKNAVTLDVDQLLAIGNVEGGVPNGFQTLYYVTGEIIESMFTNGEPSGIIRMIDKFGNEKTY